jgi:flavin reductase (DIM6/NTAB) family NADH-FMN oxidoreductase RutF
MDFCRFRNAPGPFPTGVMVAAARTATGQLTGTTTSLFNSVSLDLPLILFSLFHQAHSFAVWQGIDRHVINDEQEQVSNQFARSKDDKWEGISPLTGDSGVPMLPNVAVVFECETQARFDGGDHEIFVARVYRQLASTANAHAPPRKAVHLHAW